MFNKFNQKKLNPVDKAGYYVGDKVIVEESITLPQPKTVH